MNYLEQSGKRDMEIPEILNREYGKEFTVERIAPMFFHFCEPTESFREYPPALVRYTLGNVIDEILEKTEFHSVFVSKNRESVIWGLQM